MIGQAFRHLNSKLNLKQSLLILIGLMLIGCQHSFSVAQSSESEDVSTTSVNQSVEIIAHRGASHDAPENTLAAVNLAWTQNADAVEVDIYLSADERIVAVHDKTLKRYGGPNKPIAAMTYQELQKHEVGRWKDKKFAGEPIPLLSEILKTVPQKKRLFIEIKCGAEILPHLKSVLKSANLDDRQTCIICFSKEVIESAATQLPQIERYWLVSLKRNQATRKVKPSPKSLIKTSNDIGADGLDLGGAIDIINADYVARLKKVGLPVYVWTVNSPEEAARLKVAGVSGITTDRPKLLKATRE
ncbi:MAG: glycerophosphodiester phosphodiesterase [Planctomycetaceae bacterium]|jgi:glycerophosphoryl diester phosphodiesterase|nr:glycerophosphodiester phosphodiesterase [bacterium]MDG2389455.1 glycerophosphodiester phosphodiesterase [Planctomycetaceae bacterium]